MCIHVPHMVIVVGTSQGSQQFLDVSAAFSAFISKNGRLTITYVDHEACIHPKTAMEATLKFCSPTKWWWHSPTNGGGTRQPMVVVTN